eukprot:6186592-Pleurochrysis_carterae.AAC.2
MKPLSHTSHVAAPSSDEVPRSHTRHSVIPRSGWYCPPAQSVHWLMPISGATLPASHSRQAVDPSEAEKRPAGQGVHARASCPPLKLLYVPAGHACAVAFVLPAGQ